MKSDQMVDLLEMGKGRAVDSVIPFCGASHLFHSVPSLKVECVCVRACVCVCVSFVLAELQLGVLRCLL